MNPRLVQLPKTHPLIRFAQKIDYPPSGCWVWTGSKMKNGYGRFGVRDNQIRFAHRFAYAQMVGPIPEGYTIDHRCRNRACVNPEHLEAVTQRTNLIRGNGWAGRKSRTTHCPAGHVYTPENIIYWRGRRSCRVCKYARHRIWRKNRREALRS